MKRGRAALGAIATAAVLGALAASLLLEPGPRPRPAGWRDAWAGLPLEPEGSWSMDPLKRGVVQAQFFSSTDRLTRCVQRHPGADGAVVKLELLVETEQGNTHFEYVEASASSDLPPGLVPCVARALEQAAGVPTPRVPEDTRWRLEVGFLVPPLAALPKAPWWRRLLPDGWGSQRPVDRVG